MVMRNGVTFDAIPEGSVMADSSWKNLELWERVKWARSRRYDSATAAAAALGMKEGTYRCYERGPESAKFIRLEYHHARRFAREFKVRWEWLLDGVGEPWLTKAPEDASQPAASNHLRAWREYRGLTAVELGKKAGTSAQTITDLETGAAELSHKWLTTLAPALNTRPGFLLEFDPNVSDPSIFDVFGAIPKDRRSQALDILKTFRSYNRLR
jgi:transcriptional regulator with XRE-family HTH domain